MAYNPIYKVYLNGNTLPAYSGVSKDFVIPPNTASIKIEMYSPDGIFLQDSEKVSVVKNGKTGTMGTAGDSTSLESIIASKFHVPRLSSENPFIDGSWINAGSIDADIVTVNKILKTPSIVNGYYFIDIIHSRKAYPVITKRFLDVGDEGKSCFWDANTVITSDLIFYGGSIPSGLVDSLKVDRLSTRIRKSNDVEFVFKGKLSIGTCIYYIIATHDSAGKVVSRTKWKLFKKIEKELYYDNMVSIDTFFNLSIGYMESVEFGLYYQPITRFPDYAYSDLINPDKPKSQLDDAPYKKNSINTPGSTLVKGNLKISVDNYSMRNV